MAHQTGPITEIAELRRAYDQAFSEVGVVLYLLIGCLVILGIAVILRLVWGSGKIYSFKPFDPKRDRKKVESKKSRSRGKRERVRNS
jgi:hypothetical protein